MQERWRIVDLQQMPRIVGIGKGNQVMGLGADPVEGLVHLSLTRAIVALQLASQTLARKGNQDCAVGLEEASGRAESLEQSAGVNRTDARREDQPQPKVEVGGVRVV
jgi:hypothetical protein